MMLFNVDKLREMKAEISLLHGSSWDKAYIDCCETTEMSGISDYDTYAQWLVKKYPNEVIIKPFYNKSVPRAKHSDIDYLSNFYSSSYNSLSFHSYN